MGLHELFFSRVPTGQARLAGTVRALVGRHDPHLLGYFDEDADAPFLEPLVFTALSRGHAHWGLRQSLLGYLTPEMRADLGPITVRTTGDGEVYLPNLGYLSTAAGHAVVILRWDERAGHLRLSIDGDPVRHRFRPIVEVAPSTELFDADAALLARLYVDDAERTVPTRPTSVGAPHLHDVRAALAILAARYPLYPLMVDVCRKITVFEGERMNSFATMAAHGAAFMNVGTGLDEIFLVEDLVHQTGHVLFNAATAMDQQAYFELDPGTALEQVSATPAGDPRTLYVALHGVVTEALIAEVLSDCLSSGLFGGRQGHELLGRLAYIATRLFLDLRSLNVRGVFSAAGERLYEDLVAIFNRVHAAHRSELSGIDLSGQPYNFDYHRFCERNPAPRVPKAAVPC